MHSTTLEQQNGSFYEINTEDDDHVEYTSSTSKRKTIEDNYDEGLLENATFLFNESNEESLIEKVDENSLLDCHREILTVEYQRNSLTEI